MGKKMKKINELTNRQMNKICSKYLESNCAGCPLKRYNEERHIHYLYCFKQLRSLYYSNKIWYQENWKDRPDLEDALDELRKEQIELEKTDVEINEEDL